VFLLGFVRPRQQVYQEPAGGKAESLVEAVVGYTPVK